MAPAAAAKHESNAAVHPADAQPSRAIRVQTEFSRGFGDWLLRHRVGLVASTYQTGHLLFIGVRQDGRPVPSATCVSRAMGLVATPQRIYVGTMNEIWRLENMLKPDELDNDMFDRLYVPRNRQITGDIDIHELGVEPDGRIVFCNTSYSCLATPDTVEPFKPIWKPKFISRLAPEDRCHLNGLAMEGGKPRYVTCCSTGDALESWRGGRRDGGVVVDIESDATIAEGLSMPHSPRVHAGILYLVESGRGALVRIDRATGSSEDVAFLPGFARGLSIVGDYGIITISLPRGGSFNGLPIAEAMRKRGATPWRGILIVNLRSGDIVEWLRLEGDIKEFFDIAAIIGIRCPRALPGR